MDCTNSRQPFRPSQLGTQKYWDELYKGEIDNFTETGDIGEIWFGEGTQERMVRWVEERSGLPKTACIIDLGCGNGALLLALRDKGFLNLVGVDYSQYSIQLAQKIAHKENAMDIVFKTCDILCESEVQSRENQFDLCLDKGTYDAISLKEPSNPSHRLSYIPSVCRILSPGALLLITSCNWTRAEIESDFSNNFLVVGEIPAPSFSFGGQKGQTVTTLIMKKKERDQDSH